ncbi:MAG: hypothetical protein HQL30_10260 [Candidatus Omnitrophica bacterium]|nr:hypothetical protein [Candidatus Omnitrophota bacterium]
MPIKTIASVFILLALSLSLSSSAQEEKDPTPTGVEWSARSDDFKLGYITGLRDGMKETILFNIPAQGENAPKMYPPYTEKRWEKPYDLIRELDKFYKFLPQRTVPASSALVLLDHKASGDIDGSTYEAAVEDLRKIE